MKPSAAHPDPPQPRVPGSRAPSVSVPGFWNALPSWVLRGRGHFCRFFRSLLRGDNHPAPTSQVWPCPLPYPEVFRQGSHGSSLWRKKQTCLIVGLLSWLHLGSPASAPPGLGLGTSLSPKQWRMVRRLEHLAWDSEVFPRIDAPAMGRTASKVEDQDEVLAALARAAASLEGSCNYIAPDRAFYNSAASGSFSTDDRTLFSSVSSGQDFSAPRSAPGFKGASVATTTTSGPRLDFGRDLGVLSRAEAVPAKPIQADRLRFLGSPSFDPEGYLDQATLSRFLRPFDYADKPDIQKRPPPRVQVLASRAERLALFKKLADTGRLRPVKVDPSRLPYAAGLFSVVKDLSRDRLILDSRPANVLEHPPGFWTSSLSSPAALLQIVLEAGEMLRVSTADLRDYFYYFSIPQQRLERNLIKGSLSLSEATELFGFDCAPFVSVNDRVHVGLSTLAMGDSSACEFAQGSHLAVLYHHGALHGHELLLPTFPPPRGLLSIGVVIDDLVILERCLDQSLLDPEAAALPQGRDHSLGRVRLRDAHGAYTSAGLESNLDKGALDVSRSRFWGADLDGRRGLLRTNPARVWPLAFITARVATLGLVTHKLLQSLVGSWTSVFLLRRRCLSLFELCFAALRGTEPSSVIRLSPNLCDELWSWVLICPVCVANLRAQVLDVFYATDASDVLLAAVSAPLPPGVAKEAYRHCLVKGAWSRLLPQAQALLRSRELLSDGLELPEGESFTPHPFWRKLARSLQFSTCWVLEGRRSQHINLKELKAYLALERSVASRCSSVRILSGLDSQVALAALLKGRSASPALNSLLRRSLPGMLGSDLYSGLSFLKSEENSADDPTRDRVPRPPSEPLPEWFAPLARGDTAPLDTWLSRQADLLAARESEPFRPEDLERRLPPRSSSPPGVSQPSGFNFDCSFTPRLPPSRVGLKSGRAARARKKRLHNVVALHRVAFDLRPPPGLTLNPRLRGIVTLASLPRRWFLPATGPLDFSLRGALDFMSSDASFGRALIRVGSPWVLSLTPALAPDLSPYSSLAEQLLQLCADGDLFACLSFNLVGETLSVAWQPAIRSSQNPVGKPHLPQGVFDRVVRDNRLARVVSGVVGSLQASPSVAFWVLAPDSSFLWSLPGFEAFASPRSTSVCRVDFCRFGARWRRRTRVACNTDLAGSQAFCRCTSPHLRLRGRTLAPALGWTVRGSSAPKGLVLDLALSVARKLSWVDSPRHASRSAIRPCPLQALPLASAIARSANARLGEAANPGPRKPQQRNRALDLESQPLLGKQTLSLGNKGWSEFLSWSVSRLSFDPLDLFSRSAPLLAMALRAYGNWLYCSGGSLYSLRHTLLAAQRMYVELRPYSRLVWELISRWERAEPPQHRTPVPEPVLKAIVSYAWMSGFRSFAGVTLLAYYGLGRIGEVIQCRRSDLLLPSDDLWDQGSAAFLRLGSSKTATRGRPRVQHLKIVDETAVLLLTQVFSALPRSQPLFSQSPAAYRYRWNKVLKALNLEVELRLTPGGLRGGGAVEAYRRGLPVSEIQWRMRLKHLHTLEFYLQELGAVSALASLNSVAASRVRAAAMCFDSLAFSST